MKAEHNHVLYISYDGMTDPLGQSQVIPYLEGLAKKGFKFTILSCEKKSRFLEKKGLIKSILEESNINWVPLMYTKTPPVLSTIYDFFKLRKTAIQLHQKENFKIVHCRSYISSLIGLKLKLTYGVKFIFDMRGFWADERVDGKLWNLKNPLYRTIYNFFKKSERQFLQNADAIVSLTENGKKEMLTWPVMANVKTEINIIPCCVDTNLFNPKLVSEGEQDMLKRELGIKAETFLLGYLGSIGTWYMLGEMLDFFKALKIKKPLSKFMFVTFDEHDLIRSTAQKKGIEAKDIIIRGASRKEVPKMISLFDYSIFFIKPSYSKKSSSPTKQGEIMAMGVPVICKEGVGDVDQIIVKFKAGIVVKSNNYEEAIKALEIFIVDKEKIRTEATRYFSLSSGIRNYLHIYESLILKN